MTDASYGNPNLTISNTSVRDIPSPPMYIVVVSTLLYSIIFLFGIVGNILVVVVISCNRRMKTTVNMYLINLCIADMLVILVCMPTALVDIFTKEVWYFGGTMCTYFYLYDSFERRGYPSAKGILSLSAY
ncbi:hypothetical protein DPMN_041760 [Dreissena polymorpha]|uniref:G-protein coupled receptors family 1 profile domain-containing protein n=1 Tax=Dreissena polymorpha TaxID=45954 RepID=A0A9D4HU77_DREPO|nr:hypothetical protein DPMN_041760 [Dreissena polymorpha]